MKVMQVLILLLLPVPVAGVSFEVCEGDCTALIHEHAHHRAGACGHHHEDAALREDASCRCTHHHRHEQVRLLLDAGERPSRVSVSVASVGMPFLSVLLLHTPVRAPVAPLQVPPERKLSPTGAHLRPLIC